jgi:hypothetical protein
MTTQTINMAQRKSLEPWIYDTVQYYPHQIEGIRKLCRMQSFLLADEMGLGKSLQALTVFAVDVKLNISGSMIVVCPVTLRVNWSDEIEKFSSFKFVALSGTPVQRKKQLQEFASLPFPKILIVNYEQVTAHLAELNALKFDISCFDEAHYLKNHKAKRTIACQSLYAKRSFMLTGTPMLNHVNELWSLLYRIAPADFPKYWHFVNRYCNTPEAPVWMADGTFKPIGEIKESDEVMGWERVGNRRSHQVSVVVGVKRRIAPEIVRVTLESGQVIRCTPDHVWLSPSHGGGYSSGEDNWCKIGYPKGHQKWGRANGITTGLSLVIQPPVKLSPELQSQADWLCGIYDGEGSSDFIAQSLSHNPKIHARIGEVLTNLGIDYRVDPLGYQLRGGKQTFTNLLNWWGDNLQKSAYFKKRILMGNHRKTDGSVGQMNRTKDRIVSIEMEGPGEVVSMQTTTGNYIAWGYASKNCVFGGYQDKSIIGIKNEKELTSKLQSYMVRRLKSEVLDLPEVQLIERRVDLLAVQRKLYDQVVDDMRLDTVNTAEPVDIENALTKFLRLKQICGTTLPFTGKDESSKLDLAIDDAVQILDSGHKLVVFTQFRAVQECFIQRLYSNGQPMFPTFKLNGDTRMDERQQEVKNWAAVDGPSVIVCMIQVAGVGLNMTQASHGMFLDELFVPGLNQQAIDRLHRIGSSTTQPVQIYKYICKNTVENRVQQILRTKKKLFDNVVETNDWKKKLYEALAGKD